MLGSLLAVLLDNYFEAVARGLRRMRIGLDKGRVSITFIEEETIDERIAKLDIARDNLAEGLKAIEELRNTAEQNKREVETALRRLAELQRDKTIVEQELTQLKNCQRLI